MRWSMRVTGRISPDKPTSAAKHILDAIGISSLLESIAHTTAKSIAGSSTRKPPAIFKNTSFIPNLKPQRFSSTASNILSLRKSKPVLERCGVP